jgi:pimeloyl-ACP methyl ester carboxylesterase
MTVKPFTIQVPDAVLDDLNRRLEATRWPDEIRGSGWDYGSNLGYVRELVEYWRTRFDWRAQERRINAFHHYKATVDGLGIHFIHEKGQGPSPMPLVITHGWPGSFFEMSKLISPLTDPGSHGADPADAFDVVVPSMPGYGFSDHPTGRGLHVFKIADLWAKLMAEGLGYPRFGAQGVGRAVLQRAPLDRDAPRRPLRGVRGAGTAGARHPGLFPPLARLSRARGLLLSRRD